jgi:hypothetical protein
MLYNGRRKKESKAVLPHNLYNQLTIANPPLTLTKLNKGVAGNHRGRGRGREAISISYHMMQ